VAGVVYKLEKEEKPVLVFGFGGESRLVLVPF